MPGEPIHVFCCRINNFIAAPPLHTFLWISGGRFMKVYRDFALILPDFIRRFYMMDPVTDSSHFLDIDIASALSFPVSRRSGRCRGGQSKRQCDKTNETKKFWHNGTPLILWRSIRPGSVSCILREAVLC
jgi:hypothetical protein